MWNWYAKLSRSFMIFAMTKPDMHAYFVTQIVILDSDEICALKCTENVIFLVNLQGVLASILIHLFEVFRKYLQGI